MTVSTIIASTSYGEIKEGCQYKVFEVGRDWYKVQARGRVVYAPRYAFEPKQKSRFHLDFDADMA